MTAVSEVESGSFEAATPPVDTDLSAILRYASNYVLDGESPFPIPIDEAVAMSQEQLADQYPARFEYLKDLLDKANTGNLDEAEQGQAINWFSIANNLGAYVARAKKDPTSHVLYEEQVPVMEDLYQFIERDGYANRRGRIILPTGTGKTVLFSEFVKATGARTLIAVPSKELVKQTEQKFRQFANGENLDIGKIYADEKQHGAKITITTYQSLVQRTGDRTGQDGRIKPEDYPLVILDEAHHAMGQETKKALRRFDHSTVVGLTATDKYNEQRKLSTMLPIVIHEMKEHEAVEAGLIAPYVNIVMRCKTDMSKVEITPTGEYEQGSLQSAVNTPERNEAIVDMHQRGFKGWKTIAACAGVDHAIDLAQMFRDKGVNAQVIHGNMTKAQRKLLMDALNKPISEGGIEVMCNAKLIGEGVDVPTVSLALNAAPTLSYVREKQRSGRPGRIDETDPKKVSFIVDIIDEDYLKPPVLYGEESVAGAARVFPSSVDRETFGYKMPDLESLADSDLDYEMILTADEVEALAAEFASKRREPKPRAPEGWYSFNKLSKQFNVTDTKIREALKDLKIDAPDFFEEETNLYAGDDNGSRRHYSEFLAEALKAYIDEPSIAAPNYRTPAQVAALYDMHYTAVHSGLNVWAEEFPELRERCVASQGEAKTQMYFAPELVALFSSERELPDYSTKPPKSWINYNDLRAEYTPEVLESIMQVVGYSYSTIVENQMLGFERGRGKNRHTETYISPLLHSLIAKSAVVPEAWTDTQSFCDEQGITQARLDEVLPKILRRDTVLRIGVLLGMRDGQPGKFLHPSVINHLKNYLNVVDDEEAEVRKAKNRREVVTKMLGELVLPDKKPERTNKPEALTQSPAAHPKPDSSTPKSAPTKTKSAPETKVESSNETVNGLEDIVKGLSPRTKELYRQAQIERQQREAAASRSASSTGSGSPRQAQQAQNGRPARPIRRHGVRRVSDVISSLSPELQALYQESRREMIERTRDELEPVVKPQPKQTRQVKRIKPTEPRQVPTEPSVRTSLPVEQEPATPEIIAEEAEVVTSAIGRARLRQQALTRFSRS